jgi:hypothetical protein
MNHVNSRSTVSSASNRRWNVRRLMATIFLDVLRVEAGNLALKLLATGASRAGLEAMRQEEHEAGGAVWSGSNAWARA